MLAIRYVLLYLTIYKELHMFGRIFGITVTETPDTYIVAGINGRDIAKFITNVWNTSVLEKYMFKSVTGSRWGKIEFYKFFLIDVIYMLETLSKQRNQRIPSRTLNQIVTVLKEETWYRDVERDIQGRLNYKRLNDFHYKPLPHQQEIIDYYNDTPIRYHLNGALFNVTPGGGKTYLSTTCHWLSEVDRILVVCPKNALNDPWVVDLQRFFKSPPKIWTTGIGGEPPKDTQVFVYHYEALEIAIDHHRGEFHKFKYGLTLDESHNLNDINSQRTQRWLELVKLSNSKCVIHMSGTPFKAMGSEIIPLLRAIDPSFTPKVEERFKKIYGSSAAKGLDILKHRLGIMSKTIEKARLELPPPEMISYPIKTKDSDLYTLPAVKEEMRKFIAERLRYYKQREEYDIHFYNQCLERHAMMIRGDSREEQRFEHYKHCVRLIQTSGDLGALKDEVMYCKKYEFNEISKSLDKGDVKEFRSVCSIIKYLPLKIQGECLGSVVGRLRIDAHVSMCKHIPFRDICQTSTKKTLVFTSFVDVLEEAYRVCQQQEMKPTLVFAKTNNNLTGVINEFRDNPNINPLIATYNSLSTAVPMIMADTMIMINAPFRAYIQEQAISRIHRLGQDSKVAVYQCYLDTGEVPNISSRSLDIMQWSQKQVEEITGVKSPYLLEETENGDVTVSTEGFLEAELDTLITYNRQLQFTEIIPMKRGNVLAGW